MTNRLRPLGFIILVALIAACSSERPERTSDVDSAHRADVLYSENFDGYENGTLPADWWVEGGEHTYVRDGKLLIEADPQQERGPGHVATVWNSRSFSGDLRVEFDARVLASSLDVNNINFFFLYSHPSRDSTMYATRHMREDGSYNLYHDLNGYIFTFVKSNHHQENGARFRLRRCPGFELMDENFTYHSSRDTTYHVTITRRGNTLTYAVDGTAYLQAADEKYNWREGVVGIRTFHTELWIDNFIVTRLEDDGFRSVEN